MARSSGVLEEGRWVEIKLYQWVTWPWVFRWLDRNMYGSAAVQGANWVWEYCCTGSKLGVGMLLYREQIGCGSAAVQGTNWLWECCRKGSKMRGTAAVQRANWVRECCCTGRKLGAGVLLYREQIGCGIATVKGANCVWR